VGTGIQNGRSQKRKLMLLVLGGILAAVWLFAMRGQYTTGSKFHVLLPLAIMAVVSHFLLQRRKQAGACDGPTRQRQNADLLKKRS
jgi:hypothetical protein